MKKDAIIGWVACSAACLTLILIGHAESAIVPAVGGVIILALADRRP